MKLMKQQGKEIIDYSSKNTFKTTLDFVTLANMTDDFFALKEILNQHVPWEKVLDCI